MNHRVRSVIVAATAALQLLIMTGCPVKAAETVRFFPAREAPNYECLVSASWLKAVFDFHESNRRGPRPPSYRNDRFVVLEASWAPVEKAEDFLRGHIPGAIHINTDDLENGYPTWKLRTTSELHEIIGRHGITPDTTYPPAV